MKQTGQRTGFGLLFDVLGLLSPGHEDGQVQDEPESSENSDGQNGGQLAGRHIKHGNSPDLGFSFQTTIPCELK
jgi:hypothetical protein